ncbi:MAG TPA: FixH family protein [Moraxellaceae bacterium]|nr:FixH family protein [Moraxellaceae bacterium]
MNMPPSDAVKTPWYRQFWPWFIMALPASAVVAGLTTVAIAVRNQDSVVRDDWYKEGKAINQDFARDDRAKALGVAADVRIDDLTGELHVRLRQAAAGAAPERLVLYFQHPTQASGDQNLVLARRGEEFVGQLPRALNGRYHVELGTPEWRLLGTREFPRAEFSLTHE